MASRFTSASFDDASVVSTVALSGYFTFNVFVILILSCCILRLAIFTSSFWLDHSPCRAII